MLRSSSIVHHDGDTLRRTQGRGMVDRPAFRDVLWPGRNDFVEFHSAYPTSVTEMSLHDTWLRIAVSRRSLFSVLAT